MTLKKPKICIRLEYDGTKFCGWQKQPQKLSIQESLEKSLLQISGEKITVIGSGRTDAGVHAHGQVAHFSKGKAPIFHSSSKLLLALNAVLPKEISVLSIAEAPASFHARYSAQKKEYRYYLSFLKKTSPLHYNFVHNIPVQLDIELMQQAASYFIGEHDFSAFANSGRAYESTIRTIYSLSLRFINEHLLEISCTGNGFLYKMVRNIVGTLIHIGQRKNSPNFVLDLLSRKDRSLAPETAPSKGLSLFRVFYTPDPFQDKASTYLL
ncbi:tRNA pseudouridine(38-40) synthase TruA [Chlamydiifrater phoenicopteri]|uniref:tRNA pseudouridine(38-40) synthase TruA n=1 Tax=Chlamydiifrater phoenicopteri TaxID=2681469 RepID=UPI001BCC679E|nr:tRNA pseudouridine(38-40) synthase TruA [Chlamydiifrater phoenicopteri]